MYGRTDPYYRKMSKTKDKSSALKNGLKLLFRIKEIVNSLSNF